MKTKNKVGRPLSKTVTLTKEGRIRYPAHLFQAGDQVAISPVGNDAIKAIFAEVSDGRAFNYTLFGQRPGHGGQADIQRILKEMGVRPYQVYGQYEPQRAEDGSVVIHLERRKWRA